MNTNDRLAEQLALTLRGEPWHGPALMPLLDGVTAAQAASYLWPDVHSIWELVHHIATWQEVAARRLAGAVYEPTEAENFPVVVDAGAAAWAAAKDRLTHTCDALQAAIAGVREDDWEQPLPGTAGYTAYHLVLGVIQHNTYHAGQIAWLVKRL